MASRRLAAAAVIVVALFAVAGAQANSAGAPAGTAVSGCTCHAPAADPAVSVELVGLPEAYAYGEEYPFTVTVAGPAPIPVASQNQGGFQIQVSAGTILPADSFARALNETVVTHSTAGNDQRTWSVIWSAPLAGEAGTVTVWAAGNAFNGDSTNQNDAWNQFVLMVPPIDAMGGDNQTQPPPTNQTQDTPAPATIVGVAAMLGAAAWAARGRRQ